MRLRVLGCGDAFGSGGRLNTCFHVESAAGPFLVDCGASAMIAIRRFGIDPNAIRTILISHLHGDHFGGLPFFILDAQLVSRRTAPLTIAGPPGLEARLGQAMEVFFPGSSTVERKFAVEVRALEPRLRQDVNGLAVTPYVVKHASGAPPLALRIEAGGRTLCYSGDTEWVDSLVPAAKDADLFIAEAYTAEKPIRFHLDYKTLAAHLPEIGAKRVILTHLGGDLLDRAGSLPATVAEDGMVVEV